MLVWQDGSPTREGLFVVEWTNCGGYAVFDVRDVDGILFAFHTRDVGDMGCTRLDKWAIKRYVMLPHPEFEVLERAFSRSPDAEKMAREAK